MSTSEAPPKTQPIRLTEMANQAIEEAQRIRIVQRELVESGIREAPDKGMLRRAEVFEATARLLDEIGFHFKAVMAVIRPGHRKRR